MVLQRRLLEISLLLQHAAHSAAYLHHNKPLPAASRDPQTAAGGKCLMVSWVIRYIWLSFLVCLLELFNPSYLLKKFQCLFLSFLFFPLLFLWIPDLFLLCSQTSFPLKSEWQAELRDLNTDPYNTRLFEYFHRIISCWWTTPEWMYAFVAILLTHTFPQYVPVISRPVDVNLLSLLETAGVRTFQKGQNLPHNIWLYFKLI